MDHQHGSVVHRESKQQGQSAPAANVPKRNYKVLVDPQLKKGQEKLVRFDGEQFSCANHGQGPVVVRDPRPHTTRLFARRMKAELPVPRFKVDEWYIGAVPPREVTFSKLNDNITRQFMEQLCEKFGKLERVRVYHHPKTGKHMGLAKVVFTSIKSASMCIERLNQTSIMGNVINAELDCKGELLKKLHQKIIKGEMVADTMPDVIKHTQEKPKVRPNKIHGQRRKSSADDPRRKSLEILERRRSIEQSSASGPKTPPISIPKIQEKSDVRVPPIPQLPEHSSRSPNSHKGPGLNEMPNPHSLESGYGSHPGSASIIPDHSPNYGHVPANQQHHTSNVPIEEMSREDQVEANRKSENEQAKPPPIWTQDLMNRIESLLQEQNEKYNLNASESNSSLNPDNLQRISSTSHSEEDSNSPIQPVLEKREKPPEDLEDGECSGEDFGDEQSPELIQSITPSNDDLKGEKPQVENSAGPTPVAISETSRHQSRSPSPSFHFVPKHSPPRIGERPIYERHEQFPSPPPGEFFPRRIRHPSPGRPPVEFNDRFVYGARPQSPPFAHHRRHSPPFDAHRRISRSPGYDHHRHRYSPPRRRPPSPGYLRHHNIRPGHPEYLRRRTPSPIYAHHRRSPSPVRKFAGPLIRREFDYSPRRERVYFSPPRKLERHRGGFSPCHPEHERYRKRSPGGHRSPDPAKHRDHRELPPEFRERWSHKRSPSPRHSRPHGNSVRQHRKSHRSRSSSSESLQNTPTRIRSPARMQPDQRPYSPGDLPLDDSISSQGASRVQTVTSDSDSGETGAPVSAKRKERESSDDVPPISLDERLREITGEAPPDLPSPVESPKPMEGTTEPNQHVSPPASDDMEISSGGGGSEQGDQPPPPKQHPHPEMGFQTGNFRPIFPAPHGQQWRMNGPGPRPRGHRPGLRGPGPRMMWNDYNNPRFHVNQHRPMWRGPANEHVRFPPRLHNGFPQPMMNHPHGNRGGFHRLPPPPPGWNRPWIHEQQPQLMEGFSGGFQIENHEPEESEEPEQDHDDVLGDRVLLKITEELKEIIKKDLNKKVIETMAFKVYESWWDKEEALKNPKPAVGVKPTATTVTPVAPIVKTEPGTEPTPEVKTEEIKSVHNKMPALLNTFDPLNWAKGSLEMDGFRIGLGFRSAISKMPSFRVKKRTPSPVDEKRSKIEAIYRKNKADKDKQETSRKRIWLDSEGEEEDESEQESSEDEEEQKDEKSTVLHVEDVFSSSGSEEEEESDKSSAEDDDEEESDEESDEDEQDMEEAVSRNKRSLSDAEEDEEIGPPKKRPKHKLDSIEGTIKSEQIDESVSQAAASLSKIQSGGLSSSMLSPPAGSDNDMRHIHPKKRYRMLSKDETHNLDLIAEVSNRLRSDDEMSMMSDKEKAALEVLQEMKSTPERRISSTNRSKSLESCVRSLEQMIRLSESSDSMDFHLPLPLTPGRQLSEGVVSPHRSASVDSAALSDAHLASTSGSRSNSVAFPPLFNEAKSGEDELEAVEALLSIKKSQPSLLPSSKEEKEGQKARLELTQEEKDIMTAIVQEHNYFATKQRDASIPIIDPEMLQIIEEHSYSRPPTQEPKSLSKEHYDRRAKTVYEFPAPGIPLSASAAERVKLRRESKRAVPRDDVTPTARKPKPTYAKYRQRSKEEDMSLLYHMWATGLDLEDMRYLRYEYEQMLAQANVPQWANDTHWTAHPITNIPNPDASPKAKKNKRKRLFKSEQADLKPHPSGCARSEGYYKVEAKTKMIQRRLMYRQADNTEPPATSRAKKSAATFSGSNAGAENSREARHLMRRIASEFGSDASDLLKYNQLMFRKKSVKFKRSRIHGWGLFAQETIGADEMVIEYVGQLVRSLVADRREVDYTKKGIGSSYLFRIDSDHIIDATKCGNYARFMNHSCDPSCYAKVITVEGAKKIVIYSKNVIQPSEEITYDYKFPIEDDKIPCFCGAINCRGTLN